MNAEELITLALRQAGREDLTAEFLGLQCSLHVANVMLERGRRGRAISHGTRGYDKDPFRSYWDFGLDADKRATSFKHQLIEDMPLCPRLCSLFAHLSDLKADAVEKNEKAPHFFRGLTFIDIVKDAVTNCPAAKLVVETIIHYYSGLDTVRQYMEYLGYIMKEVCIIFNQEHDAIELWFQNNREKVGEKYSYMFTGVINMFANKGEASIGTYRSVNFVLTKNLENPSASYITRRPIDTCSVSPFNLSFIQNSLSNCLDNHRDCHEAGQYQNAQLPTRVIDIGSPLESEKSLKLVALPDRRERYATLSYCWGGSQEFCTTKTTMMRNMESMDHDQLLKTIRDAIWVTRELGVRYLWVDSLCIVQDDTEDKNREIAKMADIYSDSTITISAAAATTCHDGFLNGKCTADERESYQFALPSLKTQGRQTFFCLGEGEYLPHYYKAKQWPTGQRAWIYQEEFLSPRIICFFEDGFRWSCRFGGTSNNQDAARGIEHRFDDEILVRQAIFRTGNEINKPHRDAVYDAWRKMTEEISRRSLSYSADRLPAISAVVERLSKALGNEPYLTWPVFGNVGYVKVLRGAASLLLPRGLNDLLDHRGPGHRL